MRAAGTSAAPPRQYAPDREIDILHVRLDVTPDFQQRTVTGEAQLRFRPIAKPFPELQLDAVDLDIRTVTASEPIRGWQNTGKKLIVTFGTPIPADREASVTVAYRAEPVQGLYFRTPEQGYPPTDTHLFTQGESILGRHWYPCFDSPNEKFTSEIICHVPEGMTVLANGRLVAQSAGQGTGRTAFRWVQDKPHANYLMALVAGYFQQLADIHREVPLTFLTPPSRFKDATNSFAGTKDMVAFFEQEIGVPYPWAKYAQVCVADFVAGGMENTSLTILTDGTLHPAETEPVRSSQGLVAHELAHQWFGDLVTCKDWANVWLNEGFATYYEHLYEGHKHGRDAMLYELYQDARGIFEHAEDLRPIVHRRFDSPDEQFSYLSYPKGGWVLHMLRAQLGEELYRRCIKTYLDRHQYGTVVTEDLNAVIEELSGRSFDRFFDQWVYHGHYPELEVSYSWNEADKLARLNVRQTQTLSDQVLLFQFPLPVRFKTKAGVADQEFTVKEKEEDFYCPLPEAPLPVRIDPALTVLAHIRFSPPPTMLEAQLNDPDDALGRLLAVAQVSGRKTHEAVAHLKKRLNQDPFYGVRLEASRGLRSIHTDDALEALLASTNQPDARVRRQVRDDLRGFYRDSVLASATAALSTEKHADVVATLIETLAPYASPATSTLLLRYLETDSYQNELAGAAIRTMRTQDSPAYVAPLLQTLQQREQAFTSHGFAQALGTLAYLARREDHPDAVREFLARQVNHPRRTVQRAALAALGELGDPQAIAVLGPFARAAKDSPERQAAEMSIAALRAAKKPADDLRDLRQEVLDLQKEDRTLRRELDDLRKRLDKLGPPNVAAPAREPKKKKNYR